METNENVQSVEQTAAISNETLKQKIYYSNGAVIIGSNFWTIKREGKFDAADVAIPKNSVSFAGRVKHVAIVYFILALLAFTVGVVWEEYLGISFILAAIFVILGIVKSYDKVIVETHCGDGGFKLPLSRSETTACMDAIKKCLNDKE